MATFSVLNGTGLNGTGVQFGSLNIGASGVAGFPIITPTTGSVFFNDTGQLSITGTGMSFIFPSTFSGTVNSLAYSRPAVTPIFSITGMNTSLATTAGLFSGSETLALVFIFSGDDTISGSSVNDILAGYGGADTIDGGSGSDTVTYASSGAVTVNLSLSAASGGEAQGDTLTGIENLIGSSHADTLTGDGNANSLDGGNGDDTLAGLGGADTLVGGIGHDVADYSNSAAGVSVAIGGPASGGDAAGDTLTGIEGLTGSAFRDALAGDGGFNTLSGGGGTDILAGGGGPDVLDGGDGIDIVTYATSPDAVQVDLNSGTSVGGDADGDSISNVEYLTGSAFDDTLAGTDGANRLLGGSGSDILDGNDGADTLKGGDGGDQLSGGGDNDDLRGDADNDTLSGDAGDDRLLGGDGEDSLSDGAGRDAMTGGAGNDTFNFTTLDGNADVIRDWTAGDKIGITFDTGTVTVGELIAGTTFQGAAGEGIFYNTDNGRLYLFDSAEGVRTLFGVLANKPTDLAFSDFLIV